MLHVAEVTCLECVLVECSHREIRVDNILTARGNKLNLITIIITLLSGI